jgi:hypothetical protein
MSRSTYTSSYDQRCIFSACNYRMLRSCLRLMSSSHLITPGCEGVGVGGYMKLSHVLLTHTPFTLKIVCFY